VKKCAWSCWLSQSPDGIRRVGQAWRNKLSRLAVITPSACRGLAESAAGRESYIRLAHPWYQVSGTTLCTWALGAWAAAAGAAEPARIGPAAPNARIAEMMMARPIRMIPPWRLRRSAARHTGPSPTGHDLGQGGAIVGLRYSITQSKSSCTLSSNTEICTNSCIILCISKCKTMLADWCGARCRETCIVWHGGSTMTLVS